MDTLLQITGASKSFGIKELFANASMAVNEGEHIGVIGPNGAGKTTLFKVLAKQESLDSGQVIRSRNLRLGYLRQDDNWSDGESVETFVSRNCTLSSWEMKQLGRGLGLELSHFERPMSALSGGYKMRAKLLALLGEQPNLLLLDEPTNYLDLETLVFFEAFLQEFKGAYLLISHDREFLRKTCDNILEIESGEMTKFPGTLDDYFEEKELLRSQLEARALSVEAKRKEILDFVARFGAKATKARQAQSRLKSLSKLESIELKPLPTRARIQLPKAPPMPRVCFELNSCNLGYEEKVVLKNVHCQIERAEHIGIVGFNGAGKSTFLKTLSGQISPLKGSLKVAEGIKIAVFNQHVSESLNPSLSVLDSLTEASLASTTQQEIKAVAGSLLFSGDDMHKPISVLSGGERSRVALGRVILSGANVLLLDEPTNHLDFETVESLGNALSEFAGVLVVISHDRGFIKKVSKKIMEIRDSSVSLYPGTYDEYVWSLQKGVLSQMVTTQSPAFENKKEEREGSQQKNKYLELKNLDAEIRKTEKRVEKLEEEIKELENELASGEAYNKDKALRLAEVQKELSQTEENYLMFLEQREKLK